MNPDRELLSFTFPARDFGRLAEKMDVLESHWVGTSDEELRWYACWHVFDPCSLNCVHCGCSRKWDLNENPSAAERANAALLLRLREFFRAIDRPTPWADFEDPDEPDDECSVPIRVILAPVAKLAPPAMSLVGVDWAKPEPIVELLEEHKALTGELESGCICIQERMRAKSVVERARLAGKVHPLCPVCNKPAKKPLADRLIADMREKFEGEVLVPLEAEAAKRADRVLARAIDAATARKQAGYAMTCPAVDLIEGPGPVNAIEAFQQLADAAGGRFDDVDPDALIAEERYDPFPELDDPKPVFWPGPPPRLIQPPNFEVEEGFA